MTTIQYNPPVDCSINCADEELKQKFMELAKNAVLQRYGHIVKWDTGLRRFISGIRSHDGANELYYKYLDCGIIDDYEDDDEDME